jgi:hypothetical protein
MTVPVMPSPIQSIAGKVGEAALAVGLVDAPAEALLDALVDGLGDVVPEGWAGAVVDA